MSETWKNKLFYGDNLHIMREHIPDESVDLIYLDPPFNSKATYNVLFAEKNGTQSGAQVTAFKDIWHWGIESEEAYHVVVTQGSGKLADLMQALRSFLGTNDMMAYLVMMAIRLVEMKRVLKNTGSIFLHCDTTASHYLKLVMDAVFSAIYFRNEIIWYYPFAGRSKKWFPKKHDVIFWYSKSSKYIFNDTSPLVRVPITDKSVIHNYRYTDENGRRYREDPRKSGKTYRYYLDDGKLPEDVWVDIPSLHFELKERLGYPTQKPEKLLERIIAASTNEGDIVMDPFCGCGTTITAAERLNRRWIGIDITYLAVNLMRRRLVDTFGEELTPYEDE